LSESNPQNQAKSAPVSRSGELKDKSYRKRFSSTANHKVGCRCPIHNPSARPRAKKAQPEPAGTGRPALVAPSAAPRPVILDIAERDPNVLVAEGPQSLTYQRHRAIIAEWILLRNANPDLGVVEAARRLGLNRNTLSKLIKQAHDHGWLDINDPIDRLEHLILPQTVENLQRFLAEGDKTVTIETAKGTLFKVFQEAKGLGQNSAGTILAIKLELPPTMSPSDVVEGSIIGTPRRLELAPRAPIKDEKENGS